MDKHYTEFSFSSQLRYNPDDEVKYLTENEIWVDRMSGILCDHTGYERVFVEGCVRLAVLWRESFELNSRGVPITLVPKDQLRQRIKAALGDALSRSESVIRDQDGVIGLQAERITQNAFVLGFDEDSEFVNSLFSNDSE